MTGGGKWLEVAGGWRGGQVAVAHDPHEQISGQLLPASGEETQPPPLPKAQDKNHTSNTTPSQEVSTTDLGPTDTSPP